MRCILCPPKPRCRCRCGYTCGGPGVCKADFDTCLNEHWKKDCDHDFSGPMVDVGQGGRSVVCVKCGMDAMSHDCAVGP